MKTRFLPQNHVHVQALQHMIGQSSQMHHSVTTQDVAIWLGCHKATAVKYLKKLCADKQLIMRESSWHRLAVVHTWELPHHIMGQYRRGEFVSAFKIFVQLNFKRLEF